MARVRCKVVYGKAENDYGREMPCVRAICSKCDSETMSFGQGDASTKRCLVLLRQQCPRGENNLYTGA
jgi:hypothetical protein